MNIIVKTMPPEQIEPLRLKFQSIDHDKTGLIHIEELASAIKQSGFDGVSDEEI